MNKNEIKKLVKDELESVLNNEFKKHLNKPEIKKILKNINKDSLVDFVRALWTQRTFWENKIK